MRKFYERRHDKQKHEKFTNYCIVYYKKELQDSSKYLVILQERENQVALVYLASAADLDTRLVYLKAIKCSCLTFQDHKIPYQHTIATVQFFRVDPMSFIADF